MSGFQGRKTFNNYQYSHNQLSADNPFRFIGSTNNPYEPKKSNEYTTSKGEDKNQYNQYESSLSIIEKRKRNSSPTYIKNNSYNIINSKSYSKNSKENYMLYNQNKDHVAELLNYSQGTPQDYYYGNTKNKNAIQMPYSTYTTSKLNKNKNYNETPYNSIKNEKISNISSTEYYEENCGNLLKNFAYKEDANAQFRDYMEDKGISVINVNGDSDKALFCLFDGHGGDQVSKFLQSNFLKYFKEMIPFQDANESFIKLFKNLDEKIKDLNCYQVGSTACIVYITRENGQRCLYSVNIGDTRSVLISNNEYTRLSYDHRANDANEYKRIVSEGGIILGGRVYGSLMLSRAFGDWELKSYGLTCEPFIRKINITDKDKYVIIATDGIWDSLEDSDAYDISIKCDNSRELCNNIVNKSKEKWSTDNISCFVIKL